MLSWAGFKGFFSMNLLQFSLNEGSLGHAAAAEKPFACWREVIYGLKQSEFKWNASTGVIGFLVMSSGRAGPTNVDRQTKAANFERGFNLTFFEKEISCCVPEWDFSAIFLIRGRKRKSCQIDFPGAKTVNYTFHLLIIVKARLSSLIRLQRYQ